jgi:hypothetical protein
MLTLLAAAPGAGKSLVALDLARRVIAGLPFPDGAAPTCPASDVVLVDAEGPLPVLMERAQAFDIDMSRLRVITPADGKLFDLGSPVSRVGLTLTIRQVRPSLVIIDSLGAALAGGESIRKSLHALLALLPRLAERGNTAILLIHHLRKRTYAGRSAHVRPVSLDDLRGSSHIVAVARSILALSTMPPAPSSGDRPGAVDARRLEVIKANLCHRPPALRLFLGSGTAGKVVLHYAGPITAPPPPVTQVELCARWLLDLLAGTEPLRPAQIVEAAAGAGFSRSAVYRARNSLGDRILVLTRSPSGTAKQRPGTAHDPFRRWTLAPTPPSEA